MCCLRGENFGNLLHSLPSMAEPFQIPYMCIGAPRVLCCPRIGIREINKLK